MSLSKKQQIGFTCGAFDLFHAGHVLMLQEAKSVCDHLIVGVQYDPNIDRPEKNRPVQSYKERVLLVETNQFVDEIVLYETESDLYDLLKKLKPDIRIIGSDWAGKEFTGHDLNIKVHFNTREHNYSTSNLRKRVYFAERQKQECKK